LNRARYPDQQATAKFLDLGDCAEPAGTLQFCCDIYFFYRARIIEDTRTSKIRSAAQGMSSFRALPMLLIIGQ